MMKRQDEISESSKMEHFLLPLDDSGKYYNDRLNVVRCKYRGRIFDFKLTRNDLEVPNPKFHSVYLIINEEELEGAGLNEKQQSYPPGIIDESGTPAGLPYAYTVLVNKTKKSDLSDPQSGGAGFYIENTNMFDPNKIRISISPPLDIDYTSTEDNNKNLGTDNIGVFINDDTILIKTKGASITMGTEGLHLGGKIFKDSAVEETGMFTDNTIADLIGSSIPSFIASFPKFPNVGQFYAFAETAQRVVEVASKSTKILDAIG